MKAICIQAFGDPDVLKLEEISDPIALPGHVVVRVVAAGVNPVEAYIRAGKYGPRSFPFTPGTDAGGVVQSVGAGVTTFRGGDRVYVFGADGTYAAQVAVPAANVRLLPARIDFDQAAAIGVPYATAWRALFIRGQLRAGETILVHGASGSVGMAATQIAVAAGATVIGTAGSPAGLELVRKQGAASVFNHHDADYLKQIEAATAGRGVDLIAEMLANVNLDKDLGLLAKRGRVVVIGNRGRVEIDPRQMMAKDSDIRGMSLMHADAAELASIHAGLLAGLTNGTLTPVVARSFPLADAPAAHEAVMKSGIGGKLVLRP
jgi:NADPH2:quinone reductase